MKIENIFLFSSVALCIALIVDFIVLIIKYQKEKYLPICTLSEKELLDKHGSVICSCILQKRGFMPRDIIATLVSLVQKNALTIQLKKSSENGKMITEYRLYKQNTDEFLDEIEQAVINIIFRDSNECLLNLEVKKIKRKIETVNLVNSVNKKLESIGANSVKVPFKVQFINNLFFVLVCLFFVLHIVHNFKPSGFFSQLSANFVYWFVLVIKVDALMILFAFLVKMIVLLFERFKNKSIKSKIKLTDGNIVNIFTKFLITNCIALIFLVFAGNNLNFIVDILLLNISMLVMVSDDTFIAHSAKLKKDYLSLKEFEQKLETKEILDYYSQDREDMLKQYIPFIISSNIKGVNMLEYVSKIADTTMDKDEKEKYKNILKLINFEEDSINEFYFSNSLKEKK